MKKSVKKDDESQDKKEDNKYNRKDEKQEDKKCSKLEHNIGILRQHFGESTKQNRHNLKEDSNKAAVQKKSIKWDEINVTATLHPIGKDYGHMKIDERPTPYERSDPGVDPEILSKRLQELDSEYQRNRAFSASSTESEVEESPDEKRKRESFAQKRKEHYSEFKTAKQFTRQYDADDEDDD